MIDNGLHHVEFRSTDAGAKLVIDGKDFSKRCCHVSITQDGIGPPEITITLTADANVDVIGSLIGNNIEIERKNFGELVQSFRTK